MLNIDDRARMMELSRRIDILETAIRQVGTETIHKSQLIARTCRELWQMTLDDYRQELNELRFEDTH